MKAKTILCMLLALLLTGCTLPEDKDPTTSTETTAPVETKEPPVELEAVNALSFRASKESPEIYVLDNRTAAFFISEYVSGENTAYTQATVLDLYTDTVIGEARLDGALSPLLHCGGEIIALTDEAGGCVRLFDRRLREITDFEADSLSGVITEDLKYYYYIFGSALYRYEIAQGKTEEISLDWPLPLEAVTGYDPQENLLLVDAYEDPYATNPCVAAIDLDTLTYSMVSGTPTGAQLTDAGVMTQVLHGEKMSADVSWLSWTGEKTYSLPELLINNNDYSTTHISGSSYIFQICYDKRQNTNVEDVRLLHLEEGLYEASIQQYLGGKKLNAFASLPDGNLLALAVTRRGYQPFLICPEELSFTLDKAPDFEKTVLLEEEIRSHYLLTLEGGDLPGVLKQYRQWADRLEEEYGVTILLSNQCAAPASISNIAITTSDQAGLADEAGQIRFALETLEVVLEQYPEGFFLQFQNDAQERGILILLVEDIGMDMNAVGVSYRLGQWYPVALDITYGGLESTCYHELWHATEFKITEERPDLLTDAQWSQWNPQGFQYTQDLYADFSQDIEYTLFGDGTDAGSYFIDGYGKTFAYEDRARIMEYTMYSNRYARLIMKKPALRSKLYAMAEAVREVFDTTGWEDVYWERYF